MTYFYMIQRVQAEIFVEVGVDAQFLWVYFVVQVED